MALVECTETVDRVEVVHRVGRPEARLRLAVDGATVYVRKPDGTEQPIYSKKNSDPDSAAVLLTQPIKSQNGRIECWYEQDLALDLHVSKAGEIQSYTQRIVTGSKGVQGDQGPQGENAIVWRGTWASTTAYLINDAVHHNGKAWIATAQSTNSTPGVGAGWSLMAERGADTALALDQHDANTLAHPALRTRLDTVEAGGRTAVTQEAPLNVEWPEFGADPAATPAVNRAAIQAALDAVAASTKGRQIILPGLYDIDATPLTLTTHGTKLTGLGRLTSGIRTAVGDIFTIATPTTPIYKAIVENMTLHSQAGGGHIFVANGANDAAGISGMEIRNCDLRQSNAAKSIWRHTVGLYLDNLVFNCWMDHVAGATVPAWHFVVPAGNVNTNTWQRCRCTYSGEFFFHIEATTTNTWQFDNIFRDLNMEVCNGGIAKMLSCKDSHFENVDSYDLGTTTRNQFQLGTGATGLASYGARFEGCSRIGGTLGAGLYDIFSPVSGTTVNDCAQTASSASPYSVKLGGADECLIGSGMRAAVVENMFSGGSKPRNVRLMDASGVGHWTAGVATRYKAGIPADADYVVVPPIGTTAVDTTNGRWYVKTLAAEGWRYVAFV